MLDRGRKQGAAWIYKPERPLSRHRGAPGHSASAIRRRRRAVSTIRPRSVSMCAWVRGPVVAASRTSPGAGWVARSMAPSLQPISATTRRAVMRPRSSVPHCATVNGGMVAPTGGSLALVVVWDGVAPTSRQAEPCDAASAFRGPDRPLIASSDLASRTLVRPPPPDRCDPARARSIARRASALPYSSSFALTAHPHAPSWTCQYQGDRVQDGQRFAQRT